VAQTHQNLTLIGGLGPHATGQGLASSGGECLKFKVRIWSDGELIPKEVSWVNTLAALFSGLSPFSSLPLQRLRRRVLHNCSRTPRIDHLSPSLCI
jgi:hypothetical protein